MKPWTLPRAWSCDEYATEEYLRGEKHVIGNIRMTYVVPTRLVKDATASTIFATTASASLIAADIMEELPGQLLLSNYRFQFLPSWEALDDDNNTLDHNNTKQPSRAALQRLLGSLMPNIPWPFLPQDNLGPVASSCSMDYLSICEYFCVPLGCIATVEKKSNTTIALSTKDARKFKFQVAPVQLMKQVYEVLQAYVFPEDINYLFAFCHRLTSPNTQTANAQFQSQPVLLNGSGSWKMHIVQSEWKRQGIDRNPNWRISTCNHDFAEIDTYPTELIVPSIISDEVLSAAKSFRSLGRIPVLTWISKETGAALCRCSQPKVGLGNATSTSDETLVAAIAHANYQRKHVHIVDCRPKTNAMANKAKGYGVESVTNYQSASIHFMDIPNIHIVRESYTKLWALSTDATLSNLSWFAAIENTKWLCHIRGLLKAALHVVELIREHGESVLLHCSHGWDRTSQVASLAQLILDPFYRTYKGFQTLIEKDWITFGHPFQLRQSHGEKADNQGSPIFVQFLDCVWQLVNMYPSYFQFNGAMLLVLVDQVHSCRFGNFLFDCQKKRSEVGLEAKTSSVWTFLDNLGEYFIEKTFVDEQRLHPIPSFLLRGVVLWANLHLRWSAQVSLQSEHAPLLYEKNAQRHQDYRLPRSTLRSLQRCYSPQLPSNVSDLEEKIRELETRLNGMLVDTT